MWKRNRFKSKIENTRDKRENNNMNHRPLDVYPNTCFRCQKQNEEEVEKKAESNSKNTIGIRSGRIVPQDTIHVYCTVYTHAMIVSQN